MAYGFIIIFLALFIGSLGMTVSLPWLGIAALALCFAKFSYNRQRAILAAPKRRHF